MERLSESDIHLKLLLNLPIHIEGVGNFRSPKVKEVVEISESEYNKCLSIMLFDKSNLDDDLSEFSTLDVIRSILASDEDFKDYFLECLRFHLDTTVNFTHDDTYTYVSFGDVEDKNIMTDELYEYLAELVRVANKIEKPKEDEEFKAANERTKKWIIEQRKRKALIEAAKKPKVTLHSIVSGVSAMLNNPLEIGEQTIYQLYESNTRLHLIENIRNTNHGIYAGTVDGSKIKSEDLDFTGIIHK